jgi:hypothetical protein
MSHNTDVMLNVVGKIHQVRPNQKYHNYGTFKLEESRVLPFDLNPSEYYVISSWDTNSYIRVGPDGSFTVFDHYGEELEVGKEYILIRPAF